MPRNFSYRRVEEVAFSTGGTKNDGNCKLIHYTRRGTKISIFIEYLFGVECKRAHIYVYVDEETKDSCFRLNIPLRDFIKVLVDFSVVRRLVCYYRRYTGTYLGLIIIFGTYIEKKL